VTQPAQFSFVRNGIVPPIDESSGAWRTALAVAHIANEKLANELASNVLWYHADYVSPSWDRRLAPVVQIGAHIFYRRA
jgi:spore germination cell wall hydrolase CwlJ-like protein